MSVRATNWAWEIGRAGMVKGGKLLTLLRVADHADNAGVCWPGEESLAVYTGNDERTVRRHLNGMEDDDLLHRERQSAERGRGRGYDRICLHLDQPDNLSGERSGDQPDKSGASTGHSGSLQPDKSDSALYREPSKEPKQNRVAAPQPSLPQHLAAPLQQIADAKQGVVDTAAVLRACEAYPDRDLLLEAEKFAGWHLHGNGQNAGIKNLALGFRNWLKRAAPAERGKGGLAVLAPPATTGAVVESTRAKDAWAAAKTFLEERLPPGRFSHFFAPLEVAGERDGKLVLVDTSDHGGGDWVMKKMRPLVLESIDGFDDVELVDETQLELESR